MPGGQTRSNNGGPLWGRPVSPKVGGRRHLCEYTGLEHTCLPLTHSWKMFKALGNIFLNPALLSPSSEPAPKGSPLPQPRRALRVLQIALEKPSWRSPKDLDCLIPSWVQQGRQACVPVNSKSAPQLFSMGPTPQGFDASDKLQGRGSSSESFLQHLLEAGLGA